MNENYTKGVQKILKYAKNEAISFGQTYVGSEHLLLGILKDKNGTASSTLMILGCNLDKIYDRIKSLINSNDSPSIGTLFGRLSRISFALTWDITGNPCRT